MPIHRLFRLAIVCLVAATSLQAAVYHVDYAAGDDAQDGLTPQTAWKRSPGDAQAAGKAAATVLAPGDTVRFKGGVTYYGAISLRTAGAEGQPITLDGNSAGDYGQGKAIIDGGRDITGWKPCEGPEQVQGNPRWREILYADVDIDLSTNFTPGRFVSHRDAGAANQAPWQRLVLIAGGQKLLPIAQFPKPADSFFPDLPSGFQSSAKPVTIDYPHQVAFAEGSRGNSEAPLLDITHGGNRNGTVVSPFNGGTFTIELDKQADIAEIGITLHRPSTMPKMVPERIVLLVDGVEALSVAPDPTQTKMQRFALPKPVAASKLAFKLLQSNPEAPTWTKLQQVAVFTPDGTNLLQRSVTSRLTDEQFLVQQDPQHFEGLFIGVHGGNNHVYFAMIDRLDPATHTLIIPYFQAKIYPQTRYALFNAPRFIEQPGEWCVRPLGAGRSRVFLLPEELVDGQPVQVGSFELKTGIEIPAKASHVVIRDFIIQRFAGGSGGISASGTANLSISGCEVRYVSGNAGINLSHTANVSVENSVVHHCPGWTVGIYVNRIKGFRLIGNRLDTNSGSGIRHYDSKDGLLSGNTVINHIGMHSSAMNFYEGCANLVIERNYCDSTIAINRNADNLVFRNNIIDVKGRSAVCIGMWVTGKNGGTDLVNLQFLHNTFVNVDRSIGWSTAIFGQGPLNSALSPKGLVIKNNIFDRITGNLVGDIQNNIYLREVDPLLMGAGSAVEPDAQKLFVDPEKGDWRLRADSPAIGAGADLGVAEDFSGRPRAAGRVAVGAWAYGAGE